MNSILFVHLLQNIGLVNLSRTGLLGSSSLELSILLSDSGFDLVLLVVLQPVMLSLVLLLEENILLTRLVHILQQVDSGLFFALPLGLPHLVLSFSFLLHELVHKLLVSGLVGGLGFVVILELSHLISSLGLLGLFDLGESLFTGEGGGEEVLVSRLLNINLD